MKHTIPALALTAATALGCGGQAGGVYVFDPFDSSFVAKAPFETEAATYQFKKDEDTFCRRSLYLGFEEGRLKSIVN